MLVNFGGIMDKRIFVKKRDGYNNEALDLNGMARTLLEDLVNTVMVEQVEELGCVRNGYRERKLVTSVGTLTLKILYNFATAVPLNRIEFMEEAGLVNDALSRAGLQKEYGLCLG